MAYYQPPYSYDNYTGYPNGNPPPKPPANPLSIASLVLGIISDSLLVITCCVFPWISIVCSVIGLILGISGNRQGRSGVGLAGIITCGIGLALSVIVILFIIFVAVMGASGSNVIENFTYYT